MSPLHPADDEGGQRDEVGEDEKRGNGGVSGLIEGPD